MMDTLKSGIQELFGKKNYSAIFLSSMEKFVEVASSTSESEKTLDAEIILEDGGVRDIELVISCHQFKSSVIVVYTINRVISQRQPTKEQSKKLSKKRKFRCKYSDSEMDFIKKHIKVDN
jgi:hypothetical protein